MHRPKRILLGIFILLLGCGKEVEFSKYRALENGRWSREEVQEFKTPELSAEVSYDFYIQVRNDNRYPFSNLFLITELEFPEGETQRDTLEYQMAEADGSWLGQGYGSIKENKLWYKENINLPVTGVYTIRIEQAMRKNGSVDGISELEGILDVGLEIERH